MRAPNSVKRPLLYRVLKGGSGCRSSFTICLTISAFLGVTTSSAFADIVIRVARYPRYAPTAGEAPVPSDPNNFPRVPFIYQSGVNPSLAKMFYVNDENLIVPQWQRPWTLRDRDRGFRIGTVRRTVLETNSDGTQEYRQRWVLWLESPAEMLRQPLRYIYSDYDMNVPANDPRNSSTARFEPAYDCDYQRCWAAFPGLSARVTDVPTVASRFWKEFVKVAPLTYTDTLRWHFALEGPEPNPEPTSDTMVSLVAIRPGMRLRIESAVFQGIAAEGGADPNHQLRGYTNSGATYIYVTRRRVPVDAEAGPFDVVPSERYLSFDPFLETMRRSMDLGASNAASGWLDIALAAPAKYFRLYYPQIWFGGTSVGETPRQHVALVGCNVRGGLTRAAIRLMLDDPLMQWKAAAADPILSPDFRRTFVSFRGRSYIVPEIPIVVRGSRQFVPVGTSLRNVLEANLVNRSVTDVTLWRQNSTGPERVRHEGQHSEMLLEIPLLMGDEVRW